MTAHHKLWRRWSFQNAEVVLMGTESDDSTQMRSNSGGCFLCADKSEGLI